MKHIATIDTHYNENGEIIFAKIKTDRTVSAIPNLDTRDESEADALATAKHILAEYFLDVGLAETNGAEAKVERCDKWPNGKLKLCIVSFFIKV